MNTSQSQPNKSNSTANRPPQKSSRPQSAHRSHSSNRTTGGQSRPNQRGNQSRHNRNSQRKNNSGGHHSSKSQQHKHRITTDTKKNAIPPVGENVRIIPLGGVEEIGKNMSMIEVGDDIIVIDCGFQFRDEDTPGIDYILPNTTYLEERKDKIRGVIITHGHLDHIGGIPYVFPRIGNPPIYCRSFTALMIQKRQEEFRHLPPLDIHVVETTDEITLGKLPIRFFGITHTIPDSMGIIVETPYGNVVNQADFKLDTRDETVSAEEEKEYDRVAKGGVLLLMADSTNVENEGFSTPEWRVHEDLEKIIRDTDTRLIIGAFASQIERLVKIIEFAEKHGRKIVLEGRSMKTNLAVAEAAGMLKPKKGTLISAEESVSVPPHRVLILATGSQGEEFAALNRMANKSHRALAFTPHDTVVLSSSIVPGNETSVAKLKDNIARSGAKIITYRTSEFYVHGSGHGNREELRWLHNKLKPKFFVPQHGNHYMLRLHAQLAKETGMNPDRILVPDNGAIIEVQEKGDKLVRLKAEAASDLVTVDGFSIGGVQDVVIRDRQLLSQDGIFVVMIAINPRSGKLLKSPDIISRGFVYLRDEQDLLQQSRHIVKQIVEKAARVRPINFDYVKSEVTDELRKYLLQQTAKRPLVIPVVIGL
jgi:ribonuclease J